MSREITHSNDSGPWIQSFNYCGLSPPPEWIHPLLCCFLRQRSNFHQDVANHTFFSGVLNGMQGNFNWISKFKLAVKCTVAYIAAFQKHGIVAAKHYLSTWCIWVAFRLKLVLVHHHILRSQSPGSVFLECYGHYLWVRVWHVTHS